MLNSVALFTVTFFWWVLEIKIYLMWQGSPRSEWLDYAGINSLVIKTLRDIHQHSIDHSQEQLLMIKTLTINIRGCHYQRVGERRVYARSRSVDFLNYCSEFFMLLVQVELIELIAINRYWYISIDLWQRLEHSLRQKSWVQSLMCSNSNQSVVSQGIDQDHQIDVHAGIRRALCEFAEADHRFSSIRTRCRGQ